MSIKVKEERLQRAAHNWEEAEKVHPIGFINHLGKGGKPEDVRDIKDELGLPDDLADGG